MGGHFPRCDSCCGIKTQKSTRKATARSEPIGQIEAGDPLIREAVSHQAGTSQVGSIDLAVCPGTGGLRDQSLDIRAGCERCIKLACNKTIDQERPLGVPRPVTVLAVAVAVSLPRCENDATL